MGPLCEYQSTATAIAAQEDCNSPLSAYEAGLAPPASNCGAGVTTNVFTWTPDDDTPDLVYYQVCLYITRSASDDIIRSEREWRNCASVPCLPTCGTQSQPRMGRPVTEAREQAFASEL